MHRRQRKKAGKCNAVDQGIEDFSKEVGSLGKRVWEGMERRGRGCDSWFHRTFGIVGPLISSVFGLIILALLIRLLDLINWGTGNAVLAAMNGFLMGNVGLFFLIFLFFSYSLYFSGANPRAYLPLSTVVSAVGITIAFWVGIKAIWLTNLYAGIPFLSAALFHVESNLFWIFLFVLLLGYLILLIRKVFEVPGVAGKRLTMASAEKPKPGGIHRLYRSGKDHILGGVCGGIAEYLGVDPVIIRLLWVIGTLLWGFGILVYIIAWIIIPRNPGHRWK